jgi:osmotically inducible protein OsmC
MKRSAKAVWKGTGKEGKGTLSTKSEVLDDTKYSFKSRFKDGKGTNPEELIAAAHAGCFTMKLSFILNAADFVADRLETKCTITLDPGAGIVTSSALELDAEVPGVGAEAFAAMVKDAEENCPISKLLDTEITVEYKLND